MKVRPSSPVSDLFPGAGSFTAVLRKRFSTVTEELDRTAFVAAGGSLPCLWNKV